jgi:hypothetical protein
MHLTPVNSSITTTLGVVASILEAIYVVSSNATSAVDLVSTSTSQQELVIKITKLDKAIRLKIFVFMILKFMFCIKNLYSM